MSNTLRLLWVATLVVSLSPCAFAQESFATSVLAFSSQYTTTSWSAEQALGAPDTYPNYGDIPTAWASASPDGQREFLVLGYDTAAPASGVSIYETYNPGAVDTVYVRNANTGQFVRVWSGTAEAAPLQARIFTVLFPRTAFPVNAVRIAINSPAVSSWNEIDAVSLTNNAISLSLVATTPTTVAAGGTVRFRYGILNNTPSAQTGGLFFYARRGGSVVARGTVVSGTLPAGQGFTQTYTQPIPGTAPAGTYSYSVCVGLDINTPVACSGAVAVTVTNSLAGAGTEARAGGWDVVDAAPWPGEEAEVKAAARTAATAVAAYPNPFARSTEIAFSLEASSAVRLVVYDVRGREVATLADGAMEAGRHTVTFDAAGLPSGVYVYRLVAGSSAETGRLTLVQ